MKAVIVDRASVEAAAKALRVIHHVEVADALDKLASNEVVAIVLAVKQPPVIMMKMVYRYIPRSYEATINVGQSWKYVELPHAMAATKDDVPRSQYEFGVIETQKPIPNFGLRGFIEA